MVKRVVSIEDGVYGGQKSHLLITARKIRRYIKRLRSAPRNMRWKMAISATKKRLHRH